MKNRTAFLGYLVSTLLCLGGNAVAHSSTSNDQTAPAGNDKGATDYRLPKPDHWIAPRAVADGGGGTVIATAEIAATPDRIFRALTTDEVEKWWGHPDYYHMEDWKADLRVQGKWSVAVRFANGSSNHGSGEFVRIDEPYELVMTRRFDTHPTLGTRETTITYRLDAVPRGTRITVREEGFGGRSEAAYGNAEHWERVLSWLTDYLRTDAGHGPS